MPRFHGVGWLLVDMVRGLLSEVTTGGKVFGLSGLGNSRLMDGMGGSLCDCRDVLCRTVYDVLFNFFGYG